ncbi:carbon storage regulator [Luteimonas sp. MHLX1A]|uniref:carbon storage regulator n=1 Tax=Alterluteimonas muca TaxID=2878684 RepID=UPI001E347D87|nr:carbon storage regulator [Luteimonas sp. MHLX1A]MCD9046898.1 carbon storage regulator [Luteimonas sp. MHLX1A]
MLVLSRREGEGIKIGPDVVVHLLRDEGGQVKIGIEAPRDINIVRLELLDRGPAGKGQSGSRRR